jgi:hypothetical protein
MAGSILIPLKAVFDDKGIRDAQKQFGKLGNSLKGVLGAVGIGVGLAALTNGLKESAKAAVEDTKSQALLANQLMNTVGATDDQIAAVESSIKAMQFQASVADDVIRPAFAQLARATGDVAKATELTQLALDVSAGTGRDLSSVSIALSRAYAGNTASLSRLGIKAKDGVNIFDQLKTEFGGAAEAAAQNDPYQRLNIIFGEIQEQIGLALMPQLNDLANYFASPAGQKELQGYATLVKDLAGIFIFLGTTVAEFLAGFKVVGAAFGKLFSGDFAGFIELMNSRGMVDALAKLDNIGTEATKTANQTLNLTTNLDTTTTNNTTGTKKKTKAELAAEEAAKAYAKALEDLASFQDELKGMNDFSGLTTMSRELGEFQQTVVDTFNEINKKIAEGIANKTIGTKGLDGLRNFLKAQQNLLEENARQRDAIIAKRSLAQALYEDVNSSLLGTGNLASLLENQTKSVTTSVTKIVDGFAVTTKRTVDEVVGGKGVVSKLQAVVAKTKAFATQLTSLKKLGLDKDLFTQIVQAGPDVGGELAKEILDGGGDSVKALNTTFGELKTATAGIAEQTAVVMYNAGVDVAGGLVNGLLAQEQALVDAAKTLADAFNKAYQENIMALSVPDAPTVTPKVTAKTTVIAPKVTIKATPQTKTDAQKAVATINKYYAANPTAIKPSANPNFYAHA